jgi:ABC-type phosphate/phosphonate transport system ATPase subunit
MVNLHSVELVKEYCTRVIGVARDGLFLTITLPR